MAEEVRVGPVTARRGEHAFGYLPVTTLASGPDIGVGVHLFAGREPGPKLVVMSTAHGDEIGQISGLMKLAETLRPADLVGDLVVIPVQNPVAFEMGVRSSWMDSIRGDAGNINRLWPGRSNGWFAERLCHAMSTHAIAGATAVLDLHGPTSTFQISYGYLGIGEAGDTDYDLSRAFGQQLLVEKRPEELKEKRQTSGTTLTWLHAEGVPVFVTEIGRTHGLELDGTRPVPPRDPGEICHTGVTNVLKYLGMLDGELRLPPVQYTVYPEYHVRPSVGGLLVSTVTVADAGRVLPRGTEVGRVVSPYSFEVLETLTAPFEDSVLLACSPGDPFIKVCPGDYGYIFAKQENLRALPEWKAAP